MLMFSLFDSKAQSFGQPFFFRNRGEALRAFTDLANDKKAMVGLHPEDFCLFALGEFDDQTGKFVVLKAPESMGLAQEFVKSDSIMKVVQ